jgi:hypothetical protein
VEHRSPPKSIRPTIRPDRTPARTASPAETPQPNTSLKRVAGRSFETGRKRDKEKAMLTPEQRQTLRHRFRTDLFWAAREIVGMPVTETPHRKICDEFFFPIDPNKPFAEQTEIRERLLLGARGLLKSSLTRVFLLQLIVTWPDVRIGLLSSTNELAQMFVDGIKQEFFVVQNGAPSKFQRLFPEVVFPTEQKQFGESGIFINPARTRYQTVETLFSVGLRSSSSGIHSDLMIVDDPSSGKNSGPTASDETRARVTQDVRLAHALVDPTGYHLYLGTIYESEDCFSLLREDPDVRVVEAPAFTVKDSASAKRFEELNESDVSLLWEFDSTGCPRLDWSYLSKELRRDKLIFIGQYLVDSGNQNRITETLVRSHVLLPQDWASIDFNRPPDVTAAFDLGYLPDYKAANPNSRSRDYTAGAVGWRDKSQGTILADLIRGRWTGAQIAVEMAQLARKWRLDRIFIEDTYLSWLEPQIIAALRSFGCMTTAVAGIPRGNEPGLKMIRLNTIAAALHAENPEKSLWIAPRIAPEVMDRLLVELTKPKPGSSRFDDCADAVGHLLQQLERLAAQREHPDPQDSLQARFEGSLRNAMLREEIYGSRSWEPGEPIPEPRPTPFDINKVPPGQGWFIN